MRSFSIALLAILLAMTPVFSVQADMWPMANGTAMAGDAADDCDCMDCDTGIPDCSLHCRLVCAAGVASTLLPSLEPLVTGHTSLTYRAIPDDRIAGISPAKNLPPPRL